MEDFIFRDEVYFFDEDVFGDKEEHCYEVRCSDGWAIGYPLDEEDVEIEINYPKRDFVVSNESLSKYVLRYCGLYDQKAENINYGDIMLSLGIIVKEKGVDEWCSHCCEEVQLVSRFEAQICPNCGERILPCSICFMESCNECPLLD